MTLPKDIPLLLWAASLIVDFPTDNIGILKDESKWREWGNFLVQEVSFANNGAPATHAYSDWQTWAQAVFKCMASN
jgi:hypothetical protein